MSEVQKQSLDITEQEAIGRAVALLVAECPVTKDVTTMWENVSTSAVGVFPEHGAVYDQRFISGSFMASYPFVLRRRTRQTDDEGRINVETELDKIARWLCGEVIEVGATSYQLQNYPPLSDDRTIKEIEKTSTVFLAGQTVDGITDYAVYLTLRYYRKGVLH